MAIARASNSPTVSNLTGNGIRLRRFALCLSQTEFVRYFNSSIPDGETRLTGPLLSHLETGIVTPSPGLADRLSRVFESLEAGAL